MSLAFVPVSAAELRTWATGGRLDGPAAAIAVTPGLVEAFAPAGQEEAERVALLVASVAALGRTGRRLVAVVETAVRPRPDGDDEVGEVLVDLPAYPAVTSLFADAAGVEVAAAAAASSGPLAEAWDRPQVQRLLEADLLWYGPAEWAQLVGSEPSG